MFALNHNIDNLISTGGLEWTTNWRPTYKINDLGNIREKFEAVSWYTLEMKGNDMDEVVHTLKEAKSLVGKGKPIAIIMRTIMGKDVEFMEKDHNWHGVAPNDEQLAKALAELHETLGDYQTGQLTAFHLSRIGIFTQPHINSNPS
ncbi:MAG: hypothetical protein M3Y85_04255 [Bacteroidota bacterium]|nr:hypothetical protein [Bacteroidota bacterium]